jgi:hypothetical protein
MTDVSQHCQGPLRVEAVIVLGVPNDGHDDNDRSEDDSPHLLTLPERPRTGIKASRWQNRSTEEGRHRGLEPTCQNGKPLQKSFRYW